MVTDSQVLAENVQTRDGVEYVSVVCMESSATPLLQMFEYGLRADEKTYKGQLLGKRIKLKWENIRAIFGGRPQVSGKILEILK